ncbi:MAG: Cas10/Cmr2 second palm domain-containing protein, partial [Promethearchaeota archaeon]
ASLKDKGKSGNIGSIDIELTFYMIYFGGDDFFLVMDAGFTLPFILSLNERVRHLLGSKNSTYDKSPNDSLSIYPTGISMAVLITSNRSPINAVLECLNNLEGRAKEKNKRSMADLFGGNNCIAFHRTTQMPNISDINGRYDPVKLLDNYNYKFTCFPLLSDEFTDVVKDVLKLSECGITANYIKSLIELSKSSMIEEELINTKLRICYTAARMKPRSNLNVEKRLKTEGLLYLKSNFSDRGDHKVFVKYLDFIDLLTILPNDQRLLNYIKDLCGGGDEV